MAHNLHLFIVRAGDGAEACSNVESHLLDWGDENNWREAFAAVNTLGEIFVYSADHGIDSEGNYTDYFDGKEVATPISFQWACDMLNREAERVQSDNYSESYYTRHVAGEDVGSTGLFAIGKWFLSLSEAYDVARGSRYTPNNLLYGSYFGGQYDEFGLTCLGGYDFAEAPPSEQWLVLLDVHS